MNQIKKVIIEKPLKQNYVIGITIIDDKGQQYFLSQMVIDKLFEVSDELNKVKYIRTDIFSDLQNSVIKLQNGDDAK